HRGRRRLISFTHFLTRPLFSIVRALTRRTCPCLTSVLLPGVCSHSIAIDVRAVVTPGGPPARRRWPCLGRRSTKRVFGRCTTFNRFAGLGTLHALRTLVFRSRTAWLRRFQGPGTGCPR